MSRNIAYISDAISNYFREHRRSWEQLYPSERWIIDTIATRNQGDLGSVLDVGCACGGLGAALSKRYRLSRYTGIDINRQAVLAARESDDILSPHEFFEGDIASTRDMENSQFDTVFSLGCADWNVDTQEIIEASWSRVAPGGRLIISLRLSDKASVKEMDRSYQYIHYGDAFSLSDDMERAAYVVLNVNEALGILCALGARHVIGYGYWGPPSATARTPFERLAFSVFAVERPAAAGELRPTLELHLPGDIWVAPAA